MHHHAKLNAAAALTVHQSPVSLRTNALQGER